MPVLVGLTVLAVATPFSTAQAAPAAGADRFTQAPTGAIDSKLVPQSLNRDAKVKVIVELTEDPVSVVEAKQGRELSSAERESVRGRLRSQQQAVKDKARASGGTVLAEMQDAYNGVKAQVKGGEIAALAATAGVKAVHAVEVHTRDNAVSVPYLGVPQAWQSTGFTGTGVKIAIIDTGIDYTHADFAGPGTVAAFEAAKATSTAPANPALFGPTAPRVKGGWDFVGDDYDAESATNSVPVPDPNPLDCQGHGSHVAGTAAGGGVDATGAAYTGPYDASTATKAWKVGPGVAPTADLYALRVFGCEGSTDVTVEAIDWAVKNGMDVINMSLGSSYGTATDPSAVASSNAVGAGVVVVASSGNSGPNPYITGSPGTGKGVISVAANDSTAGFLGATITLPGGGTVQAINANGLSPMPAGPFTVVVLKDNPATGENEALGCSVAANTWNGIVPGGNQLSVSVRGTCARAARPIHAQRAGAAASVMINNSADYPPFEGTITVNPDDPADVLTVTIPFLGVRGLLGAAPTDDGDRLVAADGQAVTLAASTLTNPSYTNFASFSSGGPRTGDSGLKPGVTAPGVSIASAAVGTGNDVMVMSGTSMAAPHVAGLAALNVQAHPTWDSRAISANLVNTADPAKVGNYRLTLGGTGQVDVAQSLASRVTAVGDWYATESGTFREPALNFGFVESTSSYSATKKITLTNHSNSSVTYKVSSQATAQSRPATVKFSSRSVTVPRRGTATVLVTLTVPMGRVGSALTADHFAFYEVSGSAVFTAGSEELRVPYLAVPRAQANVTLSSSGHRLDTAVDGASVDGRGGGGGGGGTWRDPYSVTLTNKGGALPANADFYTLGLTDRQGDQTDKSHPGIDLRAVGVQSFADGDDQLLVFAVNSHDHYSNAARNETDVVIDVNSDGAPDWVLFAIDSGLMLTGSVDGKNEVFAYKISTGQTFVVGFLAQSPTDNSTTLLPVLASDLGITQATGTFSYSGSITSLADTAAYDEFDGMARYNPWTPALQNGQYVSVPVNARGVTVTGAVNAAAVADQKPAGVMVVVVDNKSGASEALLYQQRR